MDLFFDFSNKTRPKKQKNGLPEVQGLRRGAAGPRAFAAGTLGEAEDLPEGLKGGGSAAGGFFQVVFLRFFSLRKHEKHEKNHMKLPCFTF